MRIIAFLILAVSVVSFAYNSANKKLNGKADLKALKLNMSIKELNQKFGSPFSRQRNVLTYILDDSSQIHITLRDDVVASAILKFHRPIKIEDPQIRKLSLVQMLPPDLSQEDPSWFYAGQPAEGQIYKITQNGEIESITWVPPFSYGNNQPKNLQALFQDFRSQHVSNL